MSGRAFEWGRGAQIARRQRSWQQGPRYPKNWLINVAAVSTVLLNSSGVVASVQAGSGDARSKGLEIAEEGSQGELRIGKYESKRLPRTQ